MQIEKIDTDEAIDDGDVIWFWATNYNALFRMDKKTGKVDWVASSPGNSLIKPKIFKSLIKVKDNIILASRYGRAKIAIYNLLTERWKIIWLEDSPLEECYMKSYLAFNMCIAYEHWVYIIGCRCPIIIRLNLDNYEVEYVWEWAKDIISDKADSVRYLVKGHVKDNIAYLPMGYTNSVLMLDLKTAQTKVLDIETSINCFNEGTVIGSELWLTGRAKDVIAIYNLDTKETYDVQLVTDTLLFETEEILFYKPIDLNNRVLLFPAGEGYAFWLDKKTKAVCKYLKVEELFSDEPDSYGMKKLIFNDEGKIYLVSEKDKKWYVLNANSMEVMSFEVLIPYSKEWKKRYNNISKEDKNHGLKEYIWGLKNNFVDNLNNQEET